VCVSLCVTPNDMTFDPYIWRWCGLAVSCYVYVTRDKNSQNPQEKTVTIVSNTGEALFFLFFFQYYQLF